MNLRPKRKEIGMRSKGETGRFKSKSILLENWANFPISDS